MESIWLKGEWRMEKKQLIQPKQIHFFGLPASTMHQRPNSLHNPPPSFVPPLRGWGVRLNCTVTEIKLFRV